MQNLDFDKLDKLFGVATKDRSSEVNLSRFAKLAPNPIPLEEDDPNFKMFSKCERLGDDPTKEDLRHGHFVFNSSETKKAFDELDENEKKFIRKNLEQTCKNMETGLTCDLLCVLFEELQKRIEKLEKLHDIMDK